MEQPVLNLCGKFTSINRFSYFFNCQKSKKHARDVLLYQKCEKVRQKSVSFSYLKKNKRFKTESFAVNHKMFSLEFL